MMWLLVATGFTGAFTLRFFWRRLVELFSTPPAAGVHFSPKGGCTDVVVAELGRARREVLVLAYSFTSRPITQALIDAKLRGVKVDIVLDHSNEKEKITELPYMVEQGLEPVIDPHHAIAHNKVMVIDQKTILTGSFNFTHQAEQENAENLLVLKGHPELAASYRRDFTLHKAHARAPQLQGVPATGAALRIHTADAKSQPPHTPAKTPALDPTPGKAA
jgi:phosphatidylserine/phosphatidylglycerophosphate/cardiolipin synthase-like enzyme